MNEYIKSIQIYAHIYGKHITHAYIFIFLYKHKHNKATMKPNIIGQGCVRIWLFKSMNI